MSIYLSVCPAVRPQGTTRLSLGGFSWNLTFEYFRKSVEKIKVWFKPDNNNGTLHEDLCTFVIISRWILLRMGNISNKSCRENQNTHFMFNNFFRKSFRLWDNVKKYGTARQVTDDNITQRMRFACSITKATDTLTICNTYCFSTATMVMWTGLSITLYVHWLSCWTLNSAARILSTVLYCWTLNSAVRILSTVLYCWTLNSAARILSTVLYCWTLNSAARILCTVLYCWTLNSAARILSTVLYCWTLNSAVRILCSALLLNVKLSSKYIKHSALLLNVKLGSTYTNHSALLLNVKLGSTYIKHSALLLNVKLSSTYTMHSALLLNVKLGSTYTKHSALLPLWS
jgi:hypothetical protein